MYKYFTWTDDQGYFKGNQLIDRGQVIRLLNHMAPKSEVYATIQDYDSEGSCIGCPVYFDIDSPSLYDAYESMRNLVDELEDDGLECNVYFSGSKGFHVVCNKYIRHARCHEIMAMIARDYTSYDIDMAVYTSRRIWRCNNTWNAKGKRHKRLVNKDDGLQCMLEDNSNMQLNTDMSDLDIAGYVEELPEFSERMAEIGDDFMENFMPCMRKIWEMDAPPEGQRHQFCHIMARHCFRSGLSDAEAEQLFATHHFWGNVKRRDYAKVISSVYRTGRALIGCKSGRDAEVLQPYCHKLCRLNNKFTINNVFGGKQ